MAHNTKASKPDSFETNLARLNEIVEQMEAPEITLETALELYEEGMRLSGVCQKQMEEAEGRVEGLRKRAGGEITPEPFVAEGNGAE